MSAPPPLASPLGSLLRKAAVDAGFDLEPEIERGWWRLRASSAPGVAWVHPLPDPGGALLALPTAASLAELGAATPLPAGTAAVVPPPGAAGAIACASPHVLHAALRRVWTLRAHAPERLRTRWEDGVAAALGPDTPGTVTPVPTEVVAEVRRRVGQDVFREALLDYWEGRCAVTGLAIQELLRASHAKPWAVATDAERLNVHNGLLLAVHLDALFDRGFLTFDETGQGVLSGQLPLDVLALLGLSVAPLTLRRVQPAHRPYLAYHRIHIFRS